MKKLLPLFIFLCTIPVKAQMPASAVRGQITAQTTNAACVGGVNNGGAVDQPLNGLTNAVGVSVTGSYSGITFNIATSVDHGLTWTAQGATFSANQQSVITTSGYSDICVFASAYTSGTAIITFATSSVPPGGSSGTGAAAGQVQGTAAAGSAPVGNPVLVAGSDGAAVRTISTTGGGLINNALFVAQADGLSNNASELSASGSGAEPLIVYHSLFNGTTWDRAIYCPNTSTFSVVSTVTQVIAASGSTKIRICSFDINPSTATAGSADIVYGTGANCGTGTTTLTGAYTLPAAAVVDITPATLGATSPLTTPASQAVCVRAVTSTVNGFIVWEQH